MVSFEYNKLLTYGTLLLLLLLGHALLGVNARPKETPTQAAARQKLYRRILGLDDSDSDGGAAPVSRNDEPPATPFPAIVLAPHLDEKQFADGVPQFQSFQEPRDPFTSTNNVARSRVARASERWPWPVPPPVPPLARKTKGQVSERDEPIPSQADKTPRRRPAPRPPPKAAPPSQEESEPAFPAAVLVSATVLVTFAIHPSSSPSALDALSRNAITHRRPCLYSHWVAHPFNCRFLFRTQGTSRAIVPRFSVVPAFVTIDAKTTANATEKINAVGMDAPAIVPLRTSSDERLGSCVVALYFVVTT